MNTILLIDKLKYTWVTILIVLQCNQIAFTQTNLNNFHHISTSERFSLNSVTAISQDDRGFMWFGTRNGLLRYDGVEVKIIKENKHKKSGFRSSDIFAIHIDKLGKIWNATNDGLSVYDPENDSIYNFISDNTNNFSLSSGSISCVQEMNSGEIWVGSRNGLNVYNPEKGTFHHIFHNPSIAGSISSNYINCLYQTKDGTIWVGTENGLNRFALIREGIYEFESYHHDLDNPSSIICNSINTLLEDEKGNLWVGTSQGLDYLDPNSGIFDHFGENRENPLSNELVRALTFDRMGRLWVGTYDGINVIDKDLHVHLIKHDPEDSRSLSDNKIRALFTDKNGTVWVGSYYGGINYWDDRHLNFSKIDEGNGKKLSYTVVSAISQDDRGKIYFGTEGEGISIYTPGTNSYEYLNELNNTLKIGAIKAMYLNSENELWIGTYNSGLIYLNTKNKAHKNFSHNPSDPNTISENRVISIAKRSDNKFWIGTVTKGLNYFDPISNTFIPLQAQKNNESTIWSNSVRSLLVDHDDNLYVGTSLGLCFLPGKSIQPDSFKFSRFKVATDSSLTLEIQDIFQDSDKTIWIGALEHGLYRLQNQSLIPVELDGITSIYSILEDDKKQLWLSTNEGVVRYNPIENLVKLFDSKDGVIPNEFGRSSKLIAKDGTIYFGGASGVTTFHPNDLGGKNVFAPNVLLTGLKIFDKLVEVGDSTKILNKALAFTDHIELSYKQNIFTINFAMPNFIKPEKNEYQYRLLGLDDKWTTSNRSFVTYTIQRGGSYTFEVMGVNGDGFQSTGITTLDIIVNNPPWKTWWAYTLYSLFILSIAAVLIYFFQSRIKLKHQLEIETREFLNQQEVNKQKLQFFTNISHEFRTPLTLISGPLQQIISEYKGPNAFFRQLLVIKKNTDQLFKLINELMDFRKLENKQMRLQAAKGNIVKFSREIFLSFSQQANLNKYKYTFEADAEVIKIYFDRDKLEKVFYNLISNAFKFTPRKGEISIKLKSLKSHVEITVQDSGDGIGSDQLEKIFDRFYEIPNQKNYGKYKQGSGIGLAIAKSVVELHKGTISVESCEGVGSKFIVSLPLGRAHLLEDDIIKEFKDSEDVTQYASSIELDSVLKTHDQNQDVLHASHNFDREILIVEDNPDVGQFIMSVLQDYYRVVLVENGSLGYQKAITQQPDLIISDLMMPIMDGIEFCTKVKADIRTSHIPFILLSARTSLVYKYDGLESGADEYLYKPFEVKELLLKCKNIISTHDNLKEKFSKSGVFAPSEFVVNSMDETMMNKAFNIVQENLSNEFFDVQTFCDELGISRSLLFTKFKAWTNQTPNEFILNMRMKKASQLLEQNKYNVSEIGYKVGFKDPGYFTKAFKKHFSMTPKAYFDRFKESFHVE